MGFRISDVGFRWRRGQSAAPLTLPKSDIRNPKSVFLLVFLAATLYGQPDAGHEMFLHKGGCVSCHMIRGEGGFPGPDLSDIGATRTLRQLREALLDPSARILPDFRAVSAVTRDGREIRGVAKSYTNYSLSILDA